MKLSAPGIVLERALDAQGQSWLGTQEATGQTVVVRLLPEPPPPQANPQRLQQLVELQDPRILLPLDAVWAGRPGYLVFPHFPLSLAHARHLAHTPAQVRSWLEQALATLERAEARGLQHTALHAGNLLIDRESQLRIDGWLMGTRPAVSALQSLAEIALELLGEPSRRHPLASVCRRAQAGEFPHWSSFRQAVGEAFSQRSGRSRDYRSGLVLAVLIAALLLDFRLFFGLCSGAVAGAVFGLWLASWHYRRRPG